MKIEMLLSEIQTRTHWTQEELARKLGVSFATLNSWINGRSAPRSKAEANITALHEDVLNQRKKRMPNHRQTPGLRIFFTTPYAGKTRYQTDIDAIVTAMREDNIVITPEDTLSYTQSLASYQEQGLSHNQAHYAFIRQGIASADIVIIEASEEDIRVGHEMTLALLFHKPTLVLSQSKNFADYIAHDLLVGASYKTAEEAVRVAENFLANVALNRADASMQTMDLAADNLHSRALAKLRRLAKQESGQFGEWARLAEKQPKKIASEIEMVLGNLKKQPAWSVFAPVYNEDSPDYIQSGVASFINDIFVHEGIQKDAPIIEAACGTGALSRQLVKQGYRQILAFDNSRPMLAEAFRLSADMTEISLFEGDLYTLRCPSLARALVWTDYSSNFALDETQLTRMLTQLLKNVHPGGIIVFDIRTYTGWQVDFYSQPVTTFATERFQRIWLNHQKRKEKVIDFDVFIRVRDPDGAWASWQRESMRERMWRLEEVMRIIDTLSGIELRAVYGDDFRQVKSDSAEPGLAYFVLKKSR